MRTVVVLLLVSVLVAVVAAHSSSRRFLSCVHACTSTSSTNFRSCVDACKRNHATTTMADSETKDNRITSDYLWGLYRTELVRLLTQNKFDRPYLQVLQLTEDAYWDEDPSQLSRYADHVPFWGPYYVRSPHTISSQYSDFINNIQVGSRILDAGAHAQLQAANERYKTLNAQFLTKQTECRRAAIATTPKPTPEEFNQRVAGCVSGLQRQMNDLNWEIEYYMLIAYGVQNGDIIEARKSLTEAGNYYESMNNLRDFRAGRAGTKLDLSISGSSHIARPATWEDNPTKGVTTFIQRPFFDAGKGQLQMVTTSSQFKLNINIQAYTYIQVSPTSWYRSNIIRNWGSHTYINDPSIGQRLFGQNGTMKLRPKGFFIVRRPSMTVELDRSDAYLFDESHSSGKGGLFSSSRTSTQIKKEYTATGLFRVTLETTSDNPQIIAIDNELIA